MAIYICDICQDHKDGDWCVPTELGKYDMVCEDCASENEAVDDFEIKECVVVNPDKPQVCLELEYTTFFDGTTDTINNEVQYAINKALNEIGCPTCGTGWQVETSTYKPRIRIWLYEELATRFKLVGGVKKLTELVDQYLY